MAKVVNLDQKPAVTPALLLFNSRILSSFDLEMVFLYLNRKWDIIILMKLKYP